LVSMAVANFRKNVFLTSAVDADIFHESVLGESLCSRFG